MNADGGLHLTQPLLYSPAGGPAAGEGARPTKVVSSDEGGT
jgi:hypothetical protein